MSHDVSAKRTPQIVRAELRRALDDMSALEDWITAIDPWGHTFSAAFAFARDHAAKLAEEYAALEESPFLETSA